MAWMPEIEQIELMRELGKRMGGAEGIDRQHSQGRLTVRERLDLLLDPFQGSASACGPRGVVDGR
jgi:acetyl-CoA carboxylase carboxyltransferase component